MQLHSRNTHQHQFLLQYFIRSIIAAAVVVVVVVVFRDNFRAITAIVIIISGFF